MTWRNGEGDASMSVLAQLESARKELLDLGLRNPLLNYRARTRRIDVVDERAAGVYRTLVSDGRRMTFAPLPEALVEELEDDLLSALEADDPEWGTLLAGESATDDGGGDAAGRHRDSSLQTRLTADRLQARLLSIHANARAFIGEQGVNVLYLALGFLHWYESPASTSQRRAPVLLIPVELSRTNVRDRFHVSYSGDDLGTNLSLAEKLRVDFTMTLPEVDDSDGLDIAAYLDEVRAVVETQQRWQLVPDEIVLGFFSFGKFLMYKDLDHTRWPDLYRPEQHPLLVSVLGDGFGEPSVSIPDDANVDELVSPADVHHVVDADSSQILAMLEINGGNHLVIQGPPGTGKSQTITNVIAEAVGAGKRVLFVSEKMAALEVVKRRLDKVGLGDASLELHSHKMRKKAVLAELERTLDLGRPNLQAGEDDVTSLVALRDRLNAYCEAVNTPILETRFTPVAALGALCRIRAAGQELRELDFDEMRGWDHRAYLTARRQVQELQRRVREMGTPSENAFWGTRRESFLPTEEGPLRKRIETALAHTRELGERAAELANVASLRRPESPDDVQMLCDTVRCALDAPDLEGVNLASAEWRARRADLNELNEAGAWLAEIRERYGALLVQAAWDQDLLAERQAFLSYGSRWWGWVTPSLRRARTRLRGLCRTAPPRAAGECVALIDAVMESQLKRATFERHATLGKRLFSEPWRGEQSDWARFAELYPWIADLHTEVAEGRLPEDLPALLDGGERPPVEESAVAALEENLATHAGAVGDLLRALEMDEEDASDEDAEATDSEDGEDEWIPPVQWPLVEQLGLFRGWADDLAKLGPMVRYNAFARELGESGLESTVALANEWPAADEHLLSAFDATWFTGLLETAYRERPELRDFDRTGHEHAIQQFQALDRTLLARNRARLAREHWSNLPTSGGGEVATIRAEINKKRRHLPIRELITRAGRAMQAIKPVFMMSPMSIATFLPPGKLQFDLVVFDEASQVRPVDAFGALLRGKQCVVVGDSRQLPPSRFFDFVVGEDDLDEDEHSIAGDLESILGLFRAKGARERMLRWHYRSRHESLIAVSNEEFYDNRLFIFPSPGRTEQAAGLSFEHLPGTHYDRGRKRTNAEEARAVAAAIMEHAHRTPTLTLGVAAFSSAQRDAIELELEVLRRRDPSPEEFFAARPDEPFFVKNLENVQGDERDVILISIGYGKTSEGFLSMNFGPLNQDGGERRLNVLITRARCACRVFANFTADDLDLGRSSARGVVAMKRFLKFAAEGILEMPEGSVGEAESPFEEEVLAALAHLGHEADAQVGFAGFRIDIGVRDPDRSGRYLLGIECDGATYHSARSARDRDRLRQEILENLGWRIHRIWSTDWFRDPEAELRRAVASIERAKAHWAGVGDSPAAPAVGRVDTEPVVRHEGERASGESPREKKGTPYGRASLRVRTDAVELHEFEPARMADLVAEVVAVEGPVHIDVVTRRISEAAGLQRAGSRIRAAVARGAEHAQRQGRVRRDDCFLRDSAERAVRFRDRGGLEPWEKSAGFLPPEEVKAALVETIQAAFSMPRDEAIGATVRALGIRRATRAYSSVVEQAITSALAAGAIVAEDGRLLASSRK